VGAAPVMIEIRGLRIAFNGLEVLRGLDLDVHRGETLCVLGGSGCGKSVLLKCIAGLLRPTAGSIKVDGDEILGLRESDLVEVRKKIGFVFQSSALFDSLTVYENVAYPVREHRKISEEELAKIVKDRLSIVGLDGTQ
jgi:phospholipid/cholesterol/gamma-HCH transport system ATP-binding protein